MKTLRLFLLVFALGVSLSPAGSILFAAEAAATNAPAATSPVGSATVPATRSTPTNWMDRHHGFVQLAKRGDVELLFLGDSITDGWRRRGSNTWNKYYLPRKAANFGIGGDRTEHVLWRVQNGELEGINPKLTVLMIGTNNSAAHDAKSIAEGIRLIIQEVRTRCPRSKVLLLAIFPRNRANDEPKRMQTIHEVNKIIAGYDDGGKTVRFLNINEKFLGPDGKVPAEIMPDFLHPEEKGYQIWAEAMEPTLSEMLK